MRPPPRIPGLLLGALLAIIGATACGEPEHPPVAPHPVGRVSINAAALDLDALCGEREPPAEAPAEPPRSDGRAYMLAEPCIDVITEYNAIKALGGHDFALVHVSNVYNLKTGSEPYIAVSDVWARLDQCLP